MSELKHTMLELLSIEKLCYYRRLGYTRSENLGFLIKTLDYIGCIEYSYYIKNVLFYD